MNTWIAFFRGINVGGNHLLPMKALAALLETIGCHDAKTYIQSGNVIFRSPESNPVKLAEKTGVEIGKNYGFQPQILILSAGDLKQAALSNPFPHAEALPTSLHLYFLAEKPVKANLEGLNKAKIESESFVLGEKVFYLHAPDGFGRSKLAASAEKLIGVPATARNWRTVSKMLEMIQQFE